MEIFFFRIRLWECVYKQINSVIYFGPKKRGRARLEFSQRSYNGIEKGTGIGGKEKWKGQRISQGLTPIYYVSIPMYI